MGAIIALSALLGYGFMAGFTFAMCDRIWGIHRDPVLHDNPTGVLLACIWPLGLPAAYAIHKVQDWSRWIDEQEKVRTR